MNNMKNSLFLCSSSSAAAVVPWLSALLVVLLTAGGAGLCQGAAPPYGQLSVSGSKLKGSSGNAVQLVGMSLYWSQWDVGYVFWNEATVKALKCNWHVNVVRAPMGVDQSVGGYLADKTTQLTRLYAVVDAAIKLGIYVIIDWHTSTMNQAEAISFFSIVSKKYKGVPNVLYEDFNEPAGPSWVQLTVYHKAVYSAIRANDANAVIIVGTPNWDQDVDVAAQSPLDGVKNVVYALHFYAGTHKDSYIAKAQTAVNKGLPLFVSEWGTVNADGGGAVDDASTKKWMTFLNNNKISYVNWAIENKAEGAAALQPGSTSADVGNDAKLTASGKYVKALILAKNAAPTGC